MAADTFDPNDLTWFHEACAEMGMVRHGDNRPSAAMRAVADVLAGKRSRAARCTTLTAAEAQQAYDEAEAVPMSEERIQEILDFALGRK